MAFVKKITHIAEGLANLISQFDGKEKLRDVLTVFLSQIQDLEDAYAQILTDTTIDLSVGVQLDNIGDIVGEPRSGRTDEQYRTAIRARISLNNSEGTIEDIAELIISVAGIPISVSIIEFFPAAFIAEINEAVDLAIVDVNRVVATIASGRPAGVRGLLAFHVAESADSFTMGSVQSLVGLTPIGSTSIVVADTSGYASSGSLLIDAIGTLETVSYSSKNATTFFLDSSTTIVHSAGVTVQTGNSADRGFSDTAAPLVGGAFSSVIEPS